MLKRIWQSALLALGVVALAALIAEIVMALAATTHGSTPARVTDVTAGPYALKVSLYKDPANAGFSLPFAIAPRTPVNGSLHYDVSSIPTPQVDATPVHASLTPDASVTNGVQGTAEITVQGQWNLHITVTGPQGQATVDVPLQAVAPSPFPSWLGWPIGSIPVVGLLIFLLMQRGRRKASLEEELKDVAIDAKDAAGVAG